MSLKNVKVGKKILLVGAVPLILMIAIGIACALGITKLGDTNKQVDHTHNVIQQAMKIEAAAVDMETGMRGYLLAGQEGFLDPYKNGGALFHKLIVDLQKIVNDNPKQVELLSSIEKVIDEWKEKVTEPTIQLRREIGTAKTMDDMADEVGLAKGKKYFDKFRGQIATFISREAKLMKDRQELALDKTEANEGINELIIQTTTWIEHTHLVIEQAMKVGAAAGDMETGMRGFLLAGKDEFLNPYQNGGKTFDDLIAQLKNEVIDNPAQVRLLGQISDNINSWKADVTEPAIKMRRDSLKTMDDVASLVGEAGGEKYFDKFRSQIATFISREKTLMIKRQKDAQDATSLSAYNRKLIRDTTGWVEHTHNVISQAMKIEAAAVDMETGMRGYLLAGQEDFLAPYNSGSKRFQELIAELSKTVVDNPGQVKLLSETVDNIGAWKSDVTEVNIALRRKIGDAKTMNDMAALVGEARGKKYFDDFRAKIKQFRDVEATLMVSRQESAENSANSTMMIIFGGTGAAIVLSLLSAFVLTRTITKPINEALVSANKLAEGDLTHIVEVTSKDEVGVLIGSMNASVNSLNGMLSQVEQTSNKIARGTTQIASSSQALSQGACEQAASLEQITASMNSMRDQTQANAKKADEANQLADSASSSAQSGNQQMQVMVDAMKEIEESSQKISKIIKVIDEIAFQTNLLALNAAVEAARAGVHGKGFAVVAEEVRNLAARSANAARETTDLIESSVKKVNDGTKMANKTADALEEIVGSISQVTQLINDITVASVEQAEGILQTNDGLVQIDQVTQQNTANSEESAAAAEELAKQALQLQDMVGRFKLSQDTIAVEVGFGASGFAAPQIYRSKMSTPNVLVPRDALTAPETQVNSEQIIPFDDDETGRY